jgi:small conductance mechanosensitive channel
LLIAWWIGRVLRKWLEKKRIEPPIIMLVVRVVRLLIFLVVLLQALEKLNVPIVPALAGLGVAGVGVGFALQGVLGNLVAGLTIIFTKPFRIGEYIEIAGVQGQVTKIELFSTTLLHVDQSKVVVPNRKIVGEILHNCGHVRQLDLSVGVAYGTNISDALVIVREVLARNPHVLKEPAPVVGVTMLADSSINIAIKPWTSVDDFVSAQAEIYQAIIERFRAGNISIPFPQREVRLLNKA